MDKRSIRGQSLNMPSDKENDALAAEISKALSQIIDPDLNQDIVSLGFIKNMILKKSALGGYKVSFDIELTTPACPVKEDFRKQAKQLVLELDKVSDVQVNMTARTRSTKQEKSIAGIKNVIAVGSGKGGVGKSTVAVNLAYALSQLGAKVGLLDGDIYGPSFGKMLGINQSPKVQKQRIIPALVEGVSVMTFAFFAPIGEAVIWRGPQIGKALQQMLNDVDWTAHHKGEGSLDYLVVDLPPGTGDVAVTLFHTVSVTGAVLVSTPQDVAMIDTIKAHHMFEKFKIPTLGIVENMSGFVCPHCGESSQIFGEGGAEKQAQERGFPLLAKFPIDMSVMQNAEAGKPFVIADPGHKIAKLYKELAGNVAREVSKVNLKAE